jgi:cytochrome P450
MKTCLLVGPASISLNCCRGSCVSSEIPTFLVAGHETSSSLLSWILFRLSVHPEIATALREECRAAPLPIDAHGNAPLTTDELNAMDRLPILDAVVRETLRLHSPVTQTVRQATKDDILPLAKPFVDRQGQVHDHVRLAHIYSIE